MMIASYPLTNSLAIQVQTIDGDDEHIIWKGVGTEAEDKEHKVKLYYGKNGPYFYASKLRIDLRNCMVLRRV